MAGVPAAFFYANASRSERETAYRTSLSSPRTQGPSSPRVQAPSSPRARTTSGPSTSTSHPNFASIFNTALEAYKHKTKNDLTSHPLLPKLQSCDSPEEILVVLREQIPASSQHQNGDDRLFKWVIQAVNVLYSFPAALGDFGPVNIWMSPREKFLL
jgi:hypothetical protein